MNTKKLVSIFLVLAVVMAVIGFVLTNSIKFGICTVTDTVTEASCINLYERLGDPVFYGMSTLALVFLVLLFVPVAFDGWKKFAKWFVPLAALLFIFYPEPGSGDFFSPYPEQVFKWVSILYILISAVVIFKHRKSSN